MKEHLIQLRTTKELAREFKIACVVDGISMNKKLIELIIDYLEGRENN